MEKNLLINGKLVYPNKLKINKKFNIGLIGSGQMALEYIKVIESFNHKLVAIVSSSNSFSSKKISKKYKISLFKSPYLANKKNKNIDAWIVCPHWKNLKKYLYFFLNTEKPVLIEKSIALSSKELKKISYDKIKKSKIMIAYNRIYYDFLPQLVSNIKKNNLLYIEANIYDTFQKIVSSKGNEIKPHLSRYISSHWVALILKIFDLSNIKILKINKEVLQKLKQGNLVKLKFLLKQKNRKIFLNYTHFPDAPKNHSIKFYFENSLIELSPIETLTTFYKLKFVKNKKINSYKALKASVDTNKKFKPGLRFQYYDFINHFLLKKKSYLKTDLLDLTKIYKICELLQK